MSLNYTFPNKNPVFKLSETIKDSKMIYLDWNLIMSCQNLMHVTQNFEEFFNIFNKVLNKHAPMNTKRLRANQGEFMNKEHNKAIMAQSK